MACDEVRWWNEVFAAGYPDWMIKSKVQAPPDGHRWVWTGRVLEPLPAELYEPWLKAHSEPLALEQLVELFEPYREGAQDADITRYCVLSGLFVIWPWGMMDTWDMPEAYGVQPLPTAENPFPRAIPPQAWKDVLRCDRLEAMWRRAREAGGEGGAVWSDVEWMVKEKKAFFVAQPLPKAS